MPIYSDSPVRFVQYAEELGGRSEIWIPREKGLEEIDKKISQGKKSRGKKSQNDRKKSQNYTVRDSWKVCPICIYEANLMKDEVKPPYFIVTFYPGVPIDLVNIIDFDFSAFAFGEEIEYRVDEKDSYLEAFEKLGGKLAPSEEKVMPAYFSSKVIIKAKDVENKFKLSTRLTKSELNKLLPYAPMFSIIFLTSPVSISSNIYEIPITHEKIVSITSTYNYNFMKPLNSNLTTLYSIFAYSAKYNVMRKICKSESDLDNCLGNLTAEMDLYSSIDPALGVLSIGMGVGTPIDKEERFFKTFLPIAKFLLQVAGMVSEMGENISSSISSIANVLREVIKSQNVSKYDVTGFFREGIDMFLRTSFALKDKEERIGLSVSASIKSLENKYSLDDSQRARVCSALQNIFEALYRIEEQADRSLAISVANTLSSWLYIAYKSVCKGDKS